MSHIACPLCGKNAPLSSFDPESLDLDLRVIGFRGLGYGGGFAKSYENSVLGDDQYSPMVAARILDLLEMFLNEGTLPSLKVIKQLGLEKDILESSKYVTIEEHNLVLALVKYLEHQLNLEKKKTRSLDYRLFSLRQEIEEKDRLIVRERTVDRILLLLQQSCDTKISFDDKVSWVLTIYDIDEEGWEILSMIKSKVNTETKEMLKKRVQGGTDVIQNILDRILRKRKTVADTLLKLASN